jgi:hypothetical protein
MEVGHKDQPACGVVWAALSATCGAKCLWWVWQLQVQVLARIMLLACCRREECGGSDHAAQRPGSGLQAQIPRHEYAHVDDT